MTIGLFLDRYHTNFIPHLAILSAQVAQNDLIKIHPFDFSSSIDSYELCDINIFLNRLCYIDFDKITKKYLHNAYAASKTMGNSLLLAPKNKIIPNQTVPSLIKQLSIHHDTRLLKNQCYLKNINLTNCDLKDATFICFNDLSNHHVDDMKECVYKTKKIYYQNKCFVINRLTSLFDYKDTHVCKINKNLYLKWDKKRNKWIKFFQGEKYIC